MWVRDTGRTLKQLSRIFDSLLKVPFGLWLASRFCGVDRSPALPTVTSLTPLVWEMLPGMFGINLGSPFYYTVSSFSFLCGKAYRHLGEVSTKISEKLKSSWVVVCHLFTEPILRVVSTSHHGIAAAAVTHV